MGLMRPAILALLVAIAMLADYSWALLLVPILAVVYTLTMPTRCGATGETCRFLRGLSPGFLRSMDPGNRTPAPWPDYDWSGK